MRRCLVLLPLLPLLAPLTACHREDEAEVLREVKEPRRPAKLPPADFAGSYTSHWGPAECTQTHDQVECVYTSSGARMECEANGMRLKCSWTERTARGRAKFKRLPNGNLVGTMGYQQSDDNKGAWMLTKK
jgi:hypothetical protein